MPPQFMNSRIRRVGIGLICAKAILIPIALDPASDASFTLPKALLSHGLAYALVGVIAGLLIQFGPRIVVRCALHLPVLAFLLANVVASIFAMDQSVALFGTHARMLGLSTVIDWVVLYFAVVILVRTRVEGIAVWSSVVAPTAIVLGYELIQIAGRDPLSWTVDSGGRPISTFGQPTTLGAYLVIVAMGITAVVLLARLRPPIRALLVAWALALFGGAVATGTRSVLLGAAASSAMLAAIILLRASSRRVRVLSGIGVLLGALVVGLVLVLTPLGGRVGGTVVGLGSGDVDLDPNAIARLELYRIAGAIVLERPIFGYGPDNFVVGVPRYRPEPATFNIRQSLATSPHGWIPWIGTSSGLVGLVCFFAIVVVAAREVMRRADSVPVVVGATAAITFLGAGLTTVDDIALNWLFWISLSFVAASLDATPETRPIAQRNAKRARRVTNPSGPRFASVALAVAGLMSVALSAGAWSASRIDKASADARLVGRSAEAVSLGRAAVAADSGRAAYWHTLGLAYVTTANYSDAGAALDRASSIEPYNVAYLGDLVQVKLLAATQGDRSARDRAVALSATAVERDPHNPRAWLLRANALLAAGNVADAEPAIRRALALDPASQNEQLYVVAVQVMTATGHVTEAIDLASSWLLNLPPTAYALRLERARSLLTAGRPKEALDEVELVLKIRPGLAAGEQIRAAAQAAIRQ